MYARIKLKEAKHFWNAFLNSKPHSEEYVFNFSAFTSAFRSITFSLQSSYKKYDWFDELYREVLDYLSSMKIGKSLVHARNVSLKQGAKLPIIVMISKNNDTGDVFRYELEPLPFNVDPIRKIEVSFGEDSMMRCPSNASEEHKQSVYMSQLYYASKKIKDSLNVTTEFYLKINNDDEDMSDKYIKTEVDNALDFFDEIISRFEEKAGWKSLFSSQTPVSQFAALDDVTLCSSTPDLKR